MAVQDDLEWYAVRCIIRVGKVPGTRGKAYEERVTLWRAGSFGAAIERAEVDARAYADVVTGHPERYLRVAQAYRLADEPGDGAEVFSLIRVNKRGPRAYIDRFFDTGKERQRRS